MSLVNRILDALLPGRCALCADPGTRGALCAGCLNDLPWLAARCDSCGATLAAGALCADCARGERPACAVFAAMVYEYPVDRLITGAKFHGRLAFARLAGELLTLSVERWLAANVLALPDIIVPVPLHPRRLGVRGYNQALEIARPVAARFGLSLAPGVLRRTRPTREQTALSAMERRQNVQRAFLAGGGLRGARVAIIDDVVTTGSTLGAVAHAIQEAGAAHCQAWTVARSG
jgi:ComF family protein